MAEYLTNTSELTAVADAIRAKGSTSASLSFPAGFVSAISAIETGGGGYTADNIVERNFGTSILSGSASYVASYAFYYMPNIQEVSFPNVTEIKQYAFAYASALTTVSFPNVVSLGQLAFVGCPNLTGFTGPKATSFSQGVFSSCSALTTVSFNKLQNVASYAFYYCTNLQTVYLPSATTIWNNAFNLCSSKLTEISFPEVTNIYATAFSQCSKLQAISLPKTTSISLGAFYGCREMSTAYIPKMKTFGKNVFSACYKLLSVYLTSVSQVPTLGTGVFTSTPIGGYTTSTGGVYGSVFVPASLYNSFLTATNWSSISARIVSV